MIDRNNLAIDIGLELFKARTESGLTQAKLAKKMNTHQPSIARVERGDQIPSFDFLLRAARVLKCSISAPVFTKVTKK